MHARALCLPANSYYDLLKAFDYVENNQGEKIKRRESSHVMSTIKYPQNIYYDRFKAFEYVESNQGEKIKRRECSYVRLAVTWHKIGRI